VVFYGGDTFFQMVTTYKTTCRHIPEDHTARSSLWSLSLIVSNQQFVGIGLAVTGSMGAVSQKAVRMRSTIPPSVARGLLTAHIIMHSEPSVCIFMYYFCNASYISRTPCLIVLAGMPGQNLETDHNCSVTPPLFIRDHPNL
jgi:hypothetical protein